MFYLTDLGIICSMGDSHDKIMQHLFHAESGIKLTDKYTSSELPLGCVLSDLPSLETLPLKDRSRNNQLALAALSQIRPAIDLAIDRYGADRIGIVIGTSTSGIAESEHALQEKEKAGALPGYFHYAQQELSSPACMLATLLGITGPVYVHSNACASSAKALASAARLLQLDICDVVLTGGVDSLSTFVISGFTALESVSEKRCNPLSIHRDGINIGEGAALFLMSKSPATVALRGWGESSDGYHISAPDPTGNGARIAIEKALKRAGIGCRQIDYVNLHGTATIQNDAMESKLIHSMFGDSVTVSSTKPFTGHTLGAAGAIEAGLCWLTMQDNNTAGQLPPHLWDGMHDPDIPKLNIADGKASLRHPVRWCLSNSFAFGGSNAALVLGRE